MNRHATPAVIVLAMALMLAAVPDAAADHDNDPLPDEFEEEHCSSPNGELLLQPLGICQGDDIVLGVPNPGGLVGDDDADGIPDEAEVVICELAVLPEAMCNGGNLDAFAFPMETLLGPVCDAAGDVAPPEVCVLRFLTLGQSVCLARAMAPGSGAILICGVGGSITLHCSGESDVVGLVNVLYADTDCDGYTTEYEANQGCDPLDPRSYPVGPSACSEGGGGGGVTLGCSGSEDPIDILNEMYTDLDCDGYSTEYEISQGCDPTDRTQNPGAPGSCSFLMLPELAPPAPPV